MAANAFNSVHHHTLRRRHSLDCPRIPAGHSFFLKPSPAGAGAQSLSRSQHSATFAVASASTAASTSHSAAVSFDVLRQHLSAKDFRQADEETRRLIIALAGDAAQKRGYVFFSEVRFIAAEDLAAIDALWREHSSGRYGYSVQKRIWEKANRDFTKFFIKVGWMKKLEGSEIEQYNYRSFPTEFIWESGEEAAPEGHLPLTNALRGTQLLSSILRHPAFECEAAEGEAGKDGTEMTSGGEKKKGGIELMGSKGFKPNYTF